MAVLDGFNEFLGREFDVLPTLRIKPIFGDMLINNAGMNRNA
jgi:hypothetical protein